MFAIFTVAVLIVTGAVAIVALVDTWWILGVAIAIHMIMTVVVMTTIVSVMNGHARAPADGGPSPRSSAAFLKCLVFGLPS
jgi:hypothetical protein